MSEITTKEIKGLRVTLADYKKMLSQEQEKVKTKRKDLEFQEQCKVFEWVKYNKVKYPELSLLFAIPNGEYRNKITAAKLQLSGVKSGVFDMFLPVPRGYSHGLWIELKIKPNKPTKAQLAWQLDMTLHNYMAIFCYSADEVISQIISYLDYPAIL